MSFLRKAAEGLAKILVGDKPGGLAHAIFLSSGSEANESAIKLARQYFVEIGQSDRINIVSRHHSYHGNSLGCVSLTGLVVRPLFFSLSVSLFDFLVLIGWKRASPITESKKAL